MKKQNEELLDAYLRLCTTVSNERVTSDMPYNEALLCNILYHHQNEYPDTELTATDLCRLSRMLKSQMNRTLQSMEDKGIIIRKRSDADRRQVYITPNTESTLYQRQHEKVLKLVDAIIEKIGTDRVDDFIEMFTIIAKTAEEVLI